MAPRRACQSYNLSLSGCRNDGNGARVKPVVGRRERGLPHRSLRLGALAYFWKRKNCFIELSPDVSKGLHTLLAVFWKPLLSGLTEEHPCLPAFLPPRLGWCNICTAPFLAFKMCLTLHLFFCPTVSFLSLYTLLPSISLTFLNHREGVRICVSNVSHFLHQNYIYKYIIYIYNIYICIYMNCCAVPLKLTQYCKSTILQ